MIIRPFRYVIYAALIGVIVYLAVTGTANAATKTNWADGRLDQIASSIAGHPVNVYCEDDWRVWIYNGEYGVGGFTSLAGTTVWINPDECATLHYLVDGEDVGTLQASVAILYLTHESMHQRNRANPALGRNEAYTECLALKEFRSVAVNLFHVPALVNVQTYRTVTRWITRRIHRKTFRIRVSSVVSTTVTVPNPYLERLVRDAGRWDAGLPAAYHGATC
jgi:hypothetical protein